MRTVLAMMAVAGAALAGCIGGADNDAAFHAWGEGGFFTPGFGYSGAGVAAIEGPVFVDVDAEANVGFVHANFTLNGQKYEIHFDRFEASAPFHDGGIATNFREHGDSGVGDATIPAVDLRMAGWGQATVRVDGDVFKDPTGSDRWKAHFMLIENGVRDDATHAITKSDEVTPYDPAVPGDGKAVPGDREIHLVLRWTAPANTTLPAMFDFANAQPINTLSYSNRHAFVPPLGVETALELAVSSPAPAQATSLRFLVTDATGATVVDRTLNGGGSATEGFVANTAGEHSITITGQGIGAGYSIGGSYTVANYALNLFWEDVYTGAEAEEKAGAAGAHEH